MHSLLFEIMHILDMYEFLVHPVQVFQKKYKIMGHGQVKYLLVEKEHGTFES
jgi:hypothetical protein